MNRARIALLGLLAVGCADGAATSPTILDVDCPTPAARCGVFDIAENPDERSGRRVGLRFVILAASTEAPARDPVVILAGGPGQSATDFVQRFANSAMRATRDIVLLDQRGAGESPRLDCQHSTARAQDYLAPAFDPQAIAACATQLGAIADLRRYTTEAAISDLEAFRKALGYNRRSTRSIRCLRPASSTRIVTPRIPIHARIWRRSSRGSTRARHRSR